MYAQKWILWGIPIIVIISSLTHYIYEWSGLSPIVVFFAPVNESVWEHLKMPYLPTLLWWTIGYIFLVKGTSISGSQWFGSCLPAIAACPLFVAAFYYLYTGATGIHSLTMDILSMVLGIVTVQLLATHLFKYGKFKPLWFPLSITIFIIIAAIFVILTYFPPHLPLFLNPHTGEYGI